MKSNYLFEIQKEEYIQGKKNKITDFVTENFVYTKKENGKNFLYLKKENIFLELDLKNKKLITTSQKQFEQQIVQIKKFLPDISIKEEVKNNEKIYKIEGKSKIIVLTGKITTKKIDRLELTSHLDSYKYHSRISLIDIPLEKNEIIMKSEVDLNVQGQLTKNDISVIEIKELNSNQNKFDFLCNFTYEKKD